MLVKGPRGRNSFVLHAPDTVDRGRGFRTYAVELCKALALFLAIAGLILLPSYMLWRWGWAILVIPK